MPCENIKYWIFLCSICRVFGFIYVFCGLCPDSIFTKNPTLGKIEKVSQAQLCESTTHWSETHHSLHKNHIHFSNQNDSYMGYSTKINLLFIWTHCQWWQCNAQNHSTRLLNNMSFLVKIEFGHKLQSTYI